MHSTTLAVQNGSIHILEVDQPTSKLEPAPLPAVFVHGMACSADIWEAQLTYVARTRRAIAMDLRGHGASTPPADGDYSPAACAADLIRVLDALALEQIVLVGHSYGSCVSLAAAAAHPARIARLILVDPPIDCTQCPPEVYKLQIAPMQEALATEAWRLALEESFRNALAGSTPTTYEQIMARLAATPKDPLVGTGRELFTFRAVDAMDQYLLSSGKQVYAILAPSNTWPVSLHLLRPDLLATTIPNTGHWLMLDAPEAFSATLDTNLAGI